MEEDQQTPLKTDVSKLLIASQPLSGGIDASTAPHRIPADMLQYGEENNIFEMMQVTAPRFPLPPDLENSWMGRRHTLLRDPGAAGRRVRSPLPAPG